MIDQTQKRNNALSDPMISLSTISILPVESIIQPFVEPEPPPSTSTLPPRPSLLPRPSLFQSPFPLNPPHITLPNPIDIPTSSVTHTNRNSDKISLQSKIGQIINEEMLG